MLLLSSLLFIGAGGGDGLPPLRPVPFARVDIQDSFWLPRLTSHAERTLPAVIRECERTGRIKNFAICAKTAAGEHQGALYNDSDVYKVLEGIAYALAIRRDAELEKIADGWIATIALAQADDGYLNTYWMLVEPGRRFTNMAHGHELYCAGHLIEAGLAYAQATGKTRLLDVARRFADCIEREFGPGRRVDPPGHQELELALYKLARFTHEPRYAALAEFFLLQRGSPERSARYGAYAQDEIPILQQLEATGHAVRAMYQYTAMAEAAGQPNASPRWLEVLRALWQDVVERKMYVTGGIGNSAHNEGFTRAYDLNNESAYCETCASIGMVYWNQRMFLLTREARFADIVELELYNNVLAGISLEGDRFFYVNPLSSQGEHERVPWFDCSCCPTNLARALPSLGDYIWAHDEQRIWANLYIASTTTVELDSGRVALRQQGNYLDDGRVEFAVEPESDGEFSLMLRLPQWCEGEARLRCWSSGAMVMDSARQRQGEWGEWLEVRRLWRKGDRLELKLPLLPKRVYAREQVLANHGRVALQRGPLVYACEARDNPWPLAQVVLPKDALVWTAPSTDPNFAGLRLLRANASYGEPTADIAAPMTPIALTAVPYALWNNRGKGSMAVWLVENRELAYAGATRATAACAGRSVQVSHCFASDTPLALCDGLLPSASNDHSLPRHTFWDRRGTQEWLQYDFAQPQVIHTASVYWFDDTGVGQCRVPAAWRLLWWDGHAWQPVELTQGSYSTEPDAFQTVHFAPVKTQGLRLEVDLQQAYSAGILEWRVDPE